MKEFVGLRAETYAYLMDYDSGHKKAKGTEKCVIKRELMFKNYKDYQFNNEMILKSQQRFKADQNAYSKQTNNIGLNSNNDKRLQKFNKTTTYRYGTNAFKVCKTEILSKYKWLILMIMQVKTKQNVIQSGHTFLIIHTEY